MLPKPSAIVSIKQILPAIIIALALFLSLQVEGYNYSIRWFLLAWFLLLSLILGKLFVSYDKYLQLPTNKTFYSFSAFLTWAILSITWSVVPGETLLVAMTLTTCLLGMLLGFWANEKHWHYFSYMLITISLITIAYTAWQRYALDIKRPAGFLLNWNTNSAFIAIILLPHCALFLNHIKQHGKPYLFGLFIVLSAFGISLGESRGALISFLLGLCIITFSAWKMQYSLKFIALLVTLIVTGYLSGDLLNDSAIIERLSKATQLNQQHQTAVLESIGSGRHALWNAGWRMFLDKPLSGWGFGMYHNLYPQYRPPLLQEAGMYAHNDYLEFLLELGPLGLLLSLAFVLSLLHEGYKIFIQNISNIEKLHHVGLLSGCAALLIHSLFTFNLYHVPMLILLGLYTGRICKLSTPSHQKPIKISSKATKNGYYSILGSSTALLSIWALTIFLGFQSVQNSLASTSPQQQFQHLRTASRYLPLLDEFQSRQVLMILTLLSSKSSHEKLNEQEAGQFIDYATEQVNEAIKNNPLRDFNFAYKAKLLHIKSKLSNTTVDPNEIEENLKHAITINPYRLKARIMLADHYRSLGKLQSSKTTLLNGLDKMYTDEYKVGMDFLERLQESLQDSSDVAALNDVQQLIKKQQRLIDTAQSQGPFVLKIS